MQSVLPGTCFLCWKKRLLQAKGIQVDRVAGWVGIVPSAAEAALDVVPNVGAEAPPFKARIWLTLERGLMANHLDTLMSQKDGPQPYDRHAAAISPRLFPLRIYATKIVPAVCLCQPLVCFVRCPCSKKPGRSNGHPGDAAG